MTSHNTFTTKEEHQKIKHSKSEKERPSVQNYAGLIVLDATLPLIIRRALGMPDIISCMQYQEVYNMVSNKKDKAELQYFSRENKRVG